MSDIDNLELGKLVTELRETVNAKNAESAEAKEKIEKLEKGIFDIEEKNQKLVAEIAEAKKKEDEFATQLKDLERQIYMMPNSAKEERNVTVKSFERYLRVGRANLESEEAKYLRTDSNTEGGYLAPPEYVNEITKKITEISAIRSIARIRTTSTPKMEIPKRDTLMTAYWVGEGGAITESESTYGLNSIKVNKLTALASVTIEELQDAAFNIESEITQDVAEEFAEKEGASFVTGNGVNKPEGFMHTGIITQNVNSGAAADIATNAFIEMLGELKVGYNATWGLNRTTFARMLKLQDGASQFAFFTPGNLSAGIPSMILGLPYRLLPNMADIAADAYPVVLGDFAKGYTIVDHTSMFVTRDDYTLAGYGKVRYVFLKRVGGGVEVPEAFVTMRCHT